MNKIPCDMARDLMPLVIDGIASESSAAAVKNHIDTCPDCQRAFADMRAADPHTQTSDTAFIRLCKKLESGFRFRNIIIAVLAVVLLSIAGYFAYWGIMENLNSLSAPSPSSVASDVTLSIDENYNLMLNATPTDAGIWMIAEVFGNELHEYAHLSRRWDDEAEDILYLMPIEPEWLLGRAGDTNPIHYSQPDIYWIEDELHLIQYLDSIPGDLQLPQDSGRKTLTYVKISEIRWGNPDDYMTLYTLGDIVPMAN